MFASLDDDMLREIVSRIEFLHLEGQDILFREGDGGDALYIVVSGRLQVVAERPDGTRAAIGQIGTGEVVGEMALLGGELRTATVLAIRDSVIARLPKAAFDELIGRYPHKLLRVFGSAAIARTRESLSGFQLRSRPPRTIGVIAGEPNVRLNEFCSHVVQRLAGIVKTRLLSKHMVALQLGPAIHKGDGPDIEVPITHWLNEREADVDLLVYEGDPLDRAWTKKILRQSDHVLVVGDGSAFPSPPDPAFTDAVQKGVNFSVILLHSSAVSPTGASKWLQTYGIDRVHHVREGSHLDLERLARFLTGTAVGIVLSGGFARGIAHAGVLRALEECGVPRDLMGGTSIGGIVAAECILGLGYEQLVETTCAGFETCFRDVTLPFVSLIAGRNLARYMDSICGDMQIEDLPIPFFCVSTNLTRGQMHIHIQGSLTRSLLATSRAPGVFPPIVENGDLLVDGGIADNLPVVFMQAFGNGPVLASDVSASAERLHCQDYGLAVSGWKRLVRKLNVFKPQEFVPTLDYTLMRTIEFGGVASREHAMQVADFYLRPPLGCFKVNDFKQGRRMAEVAYEYARPRVEEWLRNKSTRPLENLVTTAIAI
ncbi:MAG TPA: cyclic nucleotide-binding and patatin-like phospholipase domain-containing protein [Terriglobales bacterium]|nr:cyclic nucleotide-binding and patatin-like phospholipase domain-containing protein [Terriglobales bacterium]